MDDNSFLKQYKTREELEQFAIAQQKVLVQLNKKIQALEQERNTLIHESKKIVPIAGSNARPEDRQSNLASSHEEMIAREQIFLLKQVSSQRELTYEETKKLDIYTKILQTVVITNNQKKEKEALQLPDEELLKLAETDGKSTNK